MNSIVIVENSLLIRRTIAGLLGPEYDVHGTDNAHEALELLDSRPVEWLLLNPVLAKNSGLELLYEINSWTDLRSVKTILLTHELDYFLKHETTLRELNVRHILSLAELRATTLRRCLQAEPA